MACVVGKSWGSDLGVVADRQFGRNAIGRLVEALAVVFLKLSVMSLLVDLVSIFGKAFERVLQNKIVGGLRYDTMCI
jgi:hypothetical protein